MSFGGHVLDMINRDKQNRALKKAMRERYKRIQEAYIPSNAHAGEPFVDKNKLSEKELDAYKKKIKKEFAHDRIRQSVIFGVIVIICLAGFCFLFFKLLFYLV